MERRMGRSEEGAGGLEEGAHRHAGKFPPIFERERPIAACPAAPEFHRNEKSIHGTNAITGLFHAAKMRAVREYAALRSRYLDINYRRRARPLLRFFCRLIVRVASGGIEERKKRNSIDRIARMIPQPCQGTKQRAKRCPVLEYRCVACLDTCFSLFAFASKRA